MIEPTETELEILALFRRERALIHERNKLKEKFDHAEKELRLVMDRQHELKKGLGFTGFGAL